MPWRNYLERETEHLINKGPSGMPAPGAMMIVLSSVPSNLPSAFNVEFLTHLPGGATARSLHHLAIHHEVPIAPVDFAAVGSREPHLRASAIGSLIHISAPSWRRWEDEEPCTPQTPPLSTRLCNPKPATWSRVEGVTA